jgi:hypothetical protein
MSARATTLEASSLDLRSTSAWRSSTVFFATSICGAKPWYWLFNAPKSVSARVSAALASAKAIS